MTELKIIFSSSGLGAGTHGAELGPDALRIAASEKPSDFFKNRSVERLENDHSLYSSSSKFEKEYVEQIVAFNEESCEACAASIKDGFKTIVISGDHSNANGNISGLRKALPNDNIGVIWIDAHADLHSPYSTPSQNWHGMPLAALCGFDNKKVGEAEPPEENIPHWNAFKEIGGKEISPKISPKDIVFIDIRDLEEPEWRLIKTHEIKHFQPEDRKKMGIQKIIDETLEYLSGKDTIYITFDVDSLDPDISRGTGTPVPNGLSTEEAIQLLKAFYHDERCKMLEITEINPLLDQQNKMAKEIINIIDAAL